MVTDRALKVLPVLAVACVFATGCTGISITIPTNTPMTPIVSDTPPPEIPDTPTPTATEAPPVISDEPETGVENISISAEGPWMIYTTPVGIFITNWDGRGLAKLYDFSVATPYVASSKVWAAPQGGRIAVLELINRGEINLLYPNLKIIKVPSGQLEYEHSLIPQDWIDSGLVDATGMSGNWLFETQDGLPVTQVFAATGYWNEMAWSHDSTMLAFNAAIDGNSSDLYLYKTTDGSLTRLTDGPSQSVDPVFSPDDAFILHGAVETLNWGFSGGGYDYLNVWAARSDGSEVLKVFNREVYGYEHVLSWLSDTEYLAISSEAMCGNFDLRVADILDGVRYSLIDGYHRASAFDPDSGKVLLYVDASLGGDACPTQFEPGVYLFDINTRQQIEVNGIDPNQIIDLIWNESAGLFYVTANKDGLFTVSTEGAVTQYPKPENMNYISPVVSPDGERWIFLSENSNRMAYGDLTGFYSEYNVFVPKAPIWAPNSTLALFFGENQGQSAIFGSTPQEPSPMLIEEVEWAPEKVYLVNP